MNGVQGLSRSRRSLQSSCALQHSPPRGLKTPRKAMPPTASASISQTAASPAMAAPGKAVPITVRRQSSPRPRCRSTVSERRCATR